MSIHKITLIIILILSQPFLFAQNGLVGFFPFIGNADDVSTTNIDGVPYNVTLTSDLNSNPNNAYDFNGVNSYIHCGTNNRGITDTVTVSAWIKTTDSKHQVVVEKYDWINDKGFKLETELGLAQVAGRDNGGSYTKCTGTTTINDGNWHLVMGVIYGNTWEIWVDCQLENTIISSTSNPILTNNLDLAIGYNYLGDGNNNHFNFNGTIDQVRLYNKVLSTSERNDICVSHTSISELNKNDLSVSLYPNPAENYFSIKLKDDQILFAKISISDINGKEVLTTNYVNEINISTEDFANGVYMVNITSEKSSVTKKLVISK